MWKTYQLSRTIRLITHKTADRYKFAGKQVTVTPGLELECMSNGNGWMVLLNLLDAGVSLSFEVHG